MTIAVTPHLNFHGNARQALEFYQAVFEGELVLTTYADVGVPKDTPIADMIMWGQVTTASDFRLMAYDIPTTEQLPALPIVTSRAHGLTLTQASFFISLRGQQVNEVMELWAKLADRRAACPNALGAAVWHAYRSFWDYLGCRCGIAVKAPINLSNPLIKISSIQRNSFALKKQAIPSD